MKRRTLLLLCALGVSVLFALWQWFRPYDWSADEAAGYRISQCIVERDHENFWLRVFLKQHGDSDYDMMKPALLLGAGGKEHESADTSLYGDSARKMDSLVFSFWLDPQDFSGPLQLRMNDGTLLVRKGSSVPSVASGSALFFNTSNW